MRKQVVKLLFRATYSEQRMISGRVKKRIIGKSLRTPFLIILGHPVFSATFGIAAFLSLYSMANGYPYLFQWLGAVLIVCGAFLQFFVSDLHNEQNDQIMLNDFYQQAQQETMHATASALSELANRGTMQVPTRSTISSASPGNYISKRNQSRRGFGVLELSVVTWGTFQTAFGDWLVCSINAWGFSTCSS